MPLYPARALERAMKIREVITRAMSGQINWLQAAEIIGITDRSMRRWRKHLSTGGYESLLDRRSRRPSAKRIDVAIVEKVLKLYREKYFDLNVGSRVATPFCLSICHVNCFASEKFEPLQKAFAEQAMTPGQAAPAVGVTYVTAKR